MSRPANYFHAVAALGLAGYIYSVWNCGRSGELYEAVKTDLPGYARWGLAAAILLYAMGRTGAIGMSIGSLVITAIALASGPTIAQGVEKIVTGTVGGSTK